MDHQGAGIGAPAWDCRQTGAGRDAGGVGPQAAARNGAPLRSNPLKRYEPV